MNGLRRVDGTLRLDTPRGCDLVLCTEKSRARVRYRRGSGAGCTRMVGGVEPIACSTALRTISACAACCAASEMCMRSHPPQRSTSGHGGSRRSALGSRIRISRPRARRAPRWMDASTRSPGAVPGMKTRRPSSRLPRPAPPAANVSMSTTFVSVLIGVLIGAAVALARAGSGGAFRDRWIIGGAT
jgi:hypothetical protein